MVTHYDITIKDLSAIVLKIKTPGTTSFTQYEKTLGTE